MVSISSVEIKPNFQESYKTLKELMDYLPKLNIMNSEDPEYKEMYEKYNVEITKLVENKTINTGKSSDDDNENGCEDIRLKVVNIIMDAFNNMDKDKKKFDYYKNISGLDYIHTLYLPDCETHYDYDFFYKYQDYIIVIGGFGKWMIMKSEPEEAFTYFIKSISDGDYRNIKVYKKDDKNIFSKYTKGVKSLMDAIKLHGSIDL